MTVDYSHRVIVEYRPLGGEWSGLTLDLPKQTAEELFELLTDPSRFVTGDVLLEMDLGVSGWAREKRRPMKGIGGDNL